MHLRAGCWVLPYADALPPSSLSQVIQENEKRRQTAARWLHVIAKRQFGFFLVVASVVTLGCGHPPATR